MSTGNTMQANRSRIFTPGRARTKCLLIANHTSVAYVMSPAAEVDVDEIPLANRPRTGPSLRSVTEKLRDKDAPPASLKQLQPKLLRPSWNRRKSSVKEFGLNVG